MSEDSRIRCVAVTKAGNPCRNVAQAGMVYCYVHRDQAEAAAGSAGGEVDEREARLNELIAELDGLVAELKAMAPPGDVSPYSPVRLLVLLRQNLKSVTPEMQLSILENFEGMTKEDLLDVDTWKGLTYMMSYSARFQAGQLKDKMNENLPRPLQPDTVLGFMKQNLDRLTPEVAKEIAQNFQGASREDWLDPDTWKGLWYMLTYSLQFQAEQLRQRLGEQGSRGAGEKG